MSHEVSEYVDWRLEVAFDARDVAPDISETGPRPDVWQVVVG